MNKHQKNLSKITLSSFVIPSQWNGSLSQFQVAALFNKNQKLASREHERHVFFMSTFIFWGLPDKKVFEVVFCCWKLEPEAVQVMMYSEQVKTQVMQTWLSFKCAVKRRMEHRDEDGIKTGARRFYVHLRRDEQSREIIHQPSIIQLGAIRGHSFTQDKQRLVDKCKYSWTFGCWMWEYVL